MGMKKCRFCENSKKKSLGVWGGGGGRVGGGGSRWMLTEK